jgi:[1-hydroxy-2-(trimethylamino)ethyl]phosphonate dioxygenase
VKLSKMTPACDEVVRWILELFRERGEQHYGEQITQREHALQTALLAQRAGESSALVVACLLHDLGHLLPDVPEAEAFEEDLYHEEQGARWLAKYFPAEITEPIRLHVAAKRYLCWKDPLYYQGLSAASRHSLRLQGGPMTADEANRFEAHPHHEAALRLRRYDDQGKIPDWVLPELDEFAADLRRWVRSG